MYTGVLLYNILLFAFPFETVLTLLKIYLAVCKHFFRSVHKLVYFKTSSLSCGCLKLRGIYFKVANRVSGSIQVACSRFSVSHQVGVRGVHKIYRGQTWCQFGSDAAERMFHGVPSLVAICWVLSHLCSEAGSPGVILVRSAELIRPNRLRLGPVKGRH